MAKVDSSHYELSPKVVGGTLSGAAVAIIVWAVHAIWGIDIPGSVGSALTVVVGTILGYFVRDPKREETVHTPLPPEEDV